MCTVNNLLFSIRNIIMNLNIIIILIMLKTIVSKLYKIWFIMERYFFKTPTFDGRCPLAVVQNGQLTKGFATGESAQDFAIFDYFIFALSRHIQM